MTYLIDLIREFGLGLVFINVLVEQAGAPVTQRLSPVLSAAYGQWLTGQDVPKRIELTELSEAPLPPEDDDAG